MTFDVAWWDRPIVPVWWILLLVVAYVADAIVRIRRPVASARSTTTTRTED